MKRLLMLAFIIAIFSNCPQGKSPIKPTYMIKITGQALEMGALDGFPCTDTASGNCHNDIQPTFIIQVDDFYIDQHEVTVEQYNYCVAMEECEKAATNSLSRTDYNNNSDYNRFPVTNIKWQDAKKYCEFAGRRLPTEAEWELAATKGNPNKYAWGNEATCGTGADKANIAGCIPDTTTDQADTSKVMTMNLDRVDHDGGSVYDLTGNAQEFVYNNYLAYSYCKDNTNTPEGDFVACWDALSIPNDSKFTCYFKPDIILDNNNSGDPTLSELYYPIDTEKRVVRGGYFRSTLCETSVKSRYYLASTQSSTYIGFRCASSQVPPDNASLIEPVTP